MKVALLNDTSNQKHPGCILTMQSIYHQLDRIGAEVIHHTYVTEPNINGYYKEFERADLLIVNGEGSLHHNKRMELLYVAALFPTALINSVFQCYNIPAESLRFKYAAFRESFSATDYPHECDTVPDVVYAAPFWDHFKRPEVETHIEITDSCNYREPGDIPFVTSPDFMMRTLGRASKICTGRFHGAVFCSIMDILFSAYGGNSHKIAGLCFDMGVPQHYRKERQDALLNIPDTPPDSVEEYVVAAKGKVEKMFDKLTELV